MTYNVASQEAGSDKVVLSLFAAGIMFVAGYTVVRVGLAQPTASVENSSVQNMVVPHQATLWADAFGEY